MARSRKACSKNAGIAGLLALFDSSLTGPVNIGNPDERTVLELAQLVLEVSGSKSSIVYESLPTDDPTRRCPDITLATEQLGWSPKTELRDGIARTIEFMAPQVMGA